MSKVFVKDNFFPPDFHQQLVQEMISLEYVPPTKKDIEDLKGCYWHYFSVPQNAPVQHKVTELIEENFNFKISEFVETIYTMVGATDKPRVHTDWQSGCTHQCLIYMYGEESVNNGTGFYRENGSEKELTMHVGFVQNRAIFFSSDVYHAPLQWSGNGSFRYSICNFFI